MNEAIGTGAMDLIEEAWGIIANAGGGNWKKETQTWQKTAARWRTKYFKMEKEQRQITSGPRK